MMPVTILLFSLSLLFPSQWLWQLDIEHSDSIKLEHFDDIEFGIQALTGIFALLLFAIQLLLQALGETFDFLENPITSIISSSLTLAILILFFLAIVRAR